MKNLILLLIALALGSCYTSHKARKQVLKAQAYHPEVLAGICGEMYPPVVSEKDSIRYLPGKTIVMPGETKYVNCDSPGNKGNTHVAVDCPPSTKTVDTLYLSKEKTVENTAKITALTIEKSNLQSKYDKLHVKNSFILWWAIAATALLAGAVILRLSKII